MAKQPEDNSTRDLLNDSDHLANLSPGFVPESYFDSLSNLTKISDGVLLAVKEHVVHGETQEDSAIKYSVEQSQISRAIKRLRAASKIVKSLSAYYR